jgi:hypothetical protein
MPVLKTMVTPALKSTVKGRAMALSLSESDLLRVVIIESMGNPGKTYAPAPLNAQDAQTDRMTLRMATFMLKNVRKRSKALGMSASRWVASLVQTNLMRDPVMSEVEIEALRASNRELAAIGRNLNQIARALNDNLNETDRLKLPLIDALQDAIKTNRAAISTLIRSSLKGWGVAE